MPDTFRHTGAPLQGASERACLIVDDEPGMRALLRRVMQADGFVCHEAGSGDEALTVLAQHPVPLVLSDYHMPVMDGAALLAAIQVRAPETAVVIITATADVQLAVKCLEGGALDYLTKPFAADEVRARVAQAMAKRRLLRENAAYRAQLEARVAEQASQYEELFLASLQSLADALEVKDAYTWGHSTRVSRYAMAIADVLLVSDTLRTQLELGSRLHDIGKIGVREAVLNKPGPLTGEEYAHVMEHPVIGWRILSPLLRDMPHALAVVRSHHERFDGEGTPDQLIGPCIPLEARITAVADSFDAMTSGRPYRDGMSVEEAIEELERHAGTQFDPCCVTAFKLALERDYALRPDWNVRRRRELTLVA